MVERGSLVQPHSSPYNKNLSDCCALCVFTLRASAPLPPLRLYLLRQATNKPAPPNAITANTIHNHHGAPLPSATGAGSAARVGVETASVGADAAVAVGVGAGAATSGRGPMRKAKA